jgi:sporulation integral membrane protein YlbJ
MGLWGKGRRYRSRLITFFMALATVFVTLAMVKYPKDAFDSAIMGLNLWWNVVFPSLLPFFILSEILMGLGVVHFIGVLLEPLMRPVFNVPGVGAFALSMGLASGYPMDAVITSKFRKNQLCTAVEAERLLSFTNTADPLFMFGAVAVGMFAMPELGVIIALAHYLSSFLVGIIFRFHARGRDRQTPDAAAPAGNIVVRAFRALYYARQEDKRSPGQLLGDAVKSSMNTILLIGGFIIVFSVFLRIVSVIGLTGLLETAFVWLLNAVGFSSSLAASLVSGLFEIDIGTMAASQADAPLAEKVAMAGAIIAWSGLCVHGQVASIVIESGIRIAPYIFGRLLHAVLAAVLTLLLMSHGEAVSLALSVPAAAMSGGGWSPMFWLTRFEQMGYVALLFTALLAGLSLLWHAGRGVRLLLKK